MELLHYLPQVLSGWNLLILIGGTIAGLILGATPGLSPTMAVAQERYTGPYKNMMTNSNPQPGDFPDGLMMVAAPASDHAAGLDLEGLAQYLSERVGIAVSFKACDSYDEAIKALTGGTAQLGWLGPSAYAEAARCTGPDEIALPPMASGAFGYVGYDFIQHVEPVEIENL